MAQIFRLWWGSPRVVMRKIGEDQSKTLPMGLFKKKIPGQRHNSMPEQTTHFQQTTIM